MGEQGGLRVGMDVRDAAGNQLGTVRRVYAWGFEVARGFWSPYQWVFRHDEVVRVADGVLEVARRPDDLQRLAAGGLPDTWTRRTATAAPGAPPVPASAPEARPVVPALTPGESPRAAAPATPPTSAASPRTAPDGAHAHN
jgi:hypothetical protein